MTQIQFKNIPVNELTVWQLDDESSGFAKLNNCLSLILPTEVKLKQCTGPRDFAVQLARAGKDDSLTKYNAIISDDNMMGSLSKDQQVLEQASDLNLDWADDLGYNFRNGTVTVLENMERALTNDARKFYVSLFSSGWAADKNITPDLQPALKFQLNHYYRDLTDTIFQISKREDYEKPFVEFFTNFDKLVELEV